MRNSSRFLNRKFCPLGLASSSALALATMASMPLVHAADDAKESAGKLVEEVVVTARRKDESLSKVPLSVVAMGPEQLQNRQVRSDSDLQIAVPGLTIRQTQGNNSLTYSIRGQSADTFSGSPSAVVTYLNEVPLTISGASTFYDLQSIQVLKGPQGTLFGRNATGGAVLYTTAKPTNEFEGSVKVRAGNYSLAEVEAMVNVPIVDNKVLFRAAVNSIRRDGYIENIYTGYDNKFNGDELGEIERDSLRLSLTLAPNENFENTTVVSYSKVGGTNTGASYVYSIYTTGQTNNGFSLTPYSEFLLGYVAQQKEIGAYKTQHPWSADHEGMDWIITNTTTYEINDSLRLKNIFGASHADTDSEQPQLGAPYATILTANVVTGKSGNELDVDSFSEEIQLSGMALNDNLEYIVGLYLQSQESETLWPQTYFYAGPLDPNPPSVATNHFTINTDTQALYGQTTYKLTQQLRVTAGARITHEKVTIEREPDDGYYPWWGKGKDEDTFDEPSWELGVEYDLSDDVLTYIKTRGSFRSGGFNGSTPPISTTAANGGHIFNAETTKDVEAGLKFAGTIADHPARMNVAWFKQWVKDVQRVEFPTPPPYPNGYTTASVAVTANVPELELQGLELDASITTFSWMEVGFAGSYVDSEFTDGRFVLFGTPYQFGPVANTPETSWSFWTRFNLMNKPEVGDINLYMEYYSQSLMYFSNTFDSKAPQTDLPGYKLFNARLSWDNFSGTPLSLALFGRNLDNEEYFVGGMSLATALGHNAAAVGEPRTYGIEASYKF